MPGGAASVMVDLWLSPSKKRSGDLNVMEYVTRLAAAE